jgi:ketosteroid isomerase-like protein
MAACATAAAHALIAETLPASAGSIAIHDGIYDFALTNKLTNKTSSVGARFTYVYRADTNGTWEIITHHSSVLPEVSAWRRAGARPPARPQPSELGPRLPGL